MIRKLVLLLMFSILLVSLVKAEVIISEIMYDLEEGSDAGREWVEIYSEEEVNLSGWRFYEAETNHKLNLTRGSEVFSGYALIVDNTEKFLVDNPDFDGNLFDSTFSLSNSNETIALKNSSLNIIDEITYLSNWGANGNGNSLQFVDDDWCEGIPTPGKDNKCAEETPPTEEPENESIPQDNETITVNDTEISDESADTGNESVNTIAAGQTAVKKTITTQTINENTSSESKKVIYQSKNEKTRETAIYLLIALLVLIIIYLIKSKNI